MNLNDVFIQGINDNRLDFYKVAKAILKNEDDVEDCIQDSLETAYKNLNTLKEPKYFKTWMTRIIINKSYDIIRKKRNVIPIDSEIIENSSDKNDYTEKVELKMILDKLDDDLRETFIMFYVSDYKQEEIAKVLGIPKGTVKSRLYRARQLVSSLINV
jgi:RNA polymerase sigma-70 factor (ECF subfamily)